MNSRIIASAMLASWMVAAVAAAQDKDVAEGEALYIGQCQLCHGKGSRSATSEHVPNQTLRVAFRAAAGNATDVAAGLLDGRTSAAHDMRLAFAPPFGPSLLGVYGREAGTLPGYEYSSTFLKNLKGMEWNDAALDVWITNTQAWVPGVYMFYKQPDVEIRRKIIAFLRANR